MMTLKIATDTLPHKDNRTKQAFCGNGASVADGEQKTSTGILPETKHGKSIDFVSSNNEGETNALAFGCNGNSANAGRYANANNAASNGNDNYAGAFAEHCIKGRKHSHRDHQGQTSRLEDCIATGGCGRHEYELPPFMDGGKAENDVKSLRGYAPDMDAPIWQELIKANSKTNLKGLRKFFLDKDIVTYSVQRCCKDKNKRRLVAFFDDESMAVWRRTPRLQRTDDVIISITADQIIREISNWSYTVRGFRNRELERLHKTDKQRMAKVFTLYDRCVQTVVLTITERKLQNKVLRNNYSNINGRGIFCNDRKYCLLNRLRTACWKYPQDVILLTDIKKFYDNVGWKVMCGVVFETVKDTTARWLIAMTLQTSRTLPIGSCLSPLFADILMNDYDSTILRQFKSHFFGAFGDNRCFVTDKETAVRIQQFTKSYYEGRYGVKLKGDYQIKPVSVGFSFCKTQYRQGFTRVRAELKRRAIRMAGHPRSFAGYNGILQKTDSKHLLFLIHHHIQNMKDSRGMEIPSFKGKPVDFSHFVDQRVCVVDFKRVENHKDSGYYFVFQIVAKDGVEMQLYNTHNGSKDIKSAGDFWIENKIPVPIYVTVRQLERGGYYFEEYYVSAQSACKAIVSEYKINL